MFSAYQRESVVTMGAYYRQVPTSGYGRRATERSCGRSEIAVLSIISFAHSEVISRAAMAAVLLRSIFGRNGSKGLGPDLFFHQPKSDPVRWPLIRRFRP